MSTARVQDQRCVETRPRSETRTVLLGVSGAFLLAGALGVVVNTASPFQHGWWLVAYLSLVGGLSQLLLGAGLYVLAERTQSPTPPDRLLLAQVGLWSLGTAAVAAGDLAGRRLVLLLGSTLLLIDLALFAMGLSRLRHDAAHHAPAWERCYAALLVFLAISVLVGSSLAGALPG
jgi:hypothetical protein